MGSILRNIGHKKFRAPVACSYHGGTISGRCNLWAVDFVEEAATFGVMLNETHPEAPLYRYVLGEEPEEVESEPEEEYISVSKKKGKQKGKNKVNGGTQLKVLKKLSASMQMVFMPPFKLANLHNDILNQCVFGK